MHVDIIRTLIDVRHVLELKKNLISSLGTLDSNESTYKTWSKAMRNLKSAFVVIKGKKINGFYILQRSTIIGIIVVSTLESISKTTRLCDMHFGHTSEGGFTILNKQDLPRGQKENLIFVGIMYLETMEG